VTFLSINQLKPGMILSGDVTDTNGRLLLSKGKEITANHLSIFKMWGVPEVPVKQVDGSGTEDQQPLDPVLMRRAAEKLKLDFTDNDLSHPAVAEIFRQAIIHRCRRTNGRPGPVRNQPADQKPLRMSSSTEMRKKIRMRNIKLPEAPSIIFKLNDTIADPFSSADDIARVISKSPGLSALLLKIVNSAFYGFPSRIDSVSRAVTIIGSKEVSALAVGITTMEIFKDIPKSVFDMQTFTHHSLACGVLARILAAGGNVRNTEQLFVSGLLHDIGRLVIFKYFPQEAAYMLSNLSISGESLYESEKAVMGFRHTDIAGDLFDQWKFPVALSQNVVYHHRPMASPDHKKAAIIHLSDIIAHSLDEGKSGERGVPVLDTAAWATLHIAPQTLATIIPQAIHHLSFLMTVFKGSD
jgi:HD-like signal output (HDOD) protein